ncbi:MAG: glycosyltransferase [Candidatus Cloacimonetes bacterium]|nr:glycosyltransferase [Candidatus Cloacimonadota bacterium]
MKRALIITYYWPPSGGSGVQRWLKFVKYLPELDWMPTVITTENGDYPAIDESLLSDVPKEIEVIRTKTPTFGKLFKKIIGKNVPYGSLETEKDDSLLRKISIWMRLNFVIPDARKIWNKHAFQAASKELLTNKYDVLITTGPPHSTHLVGLKLKKKFKIKWLTDFRDPWTKMGYLKNVKRWKTATFIDTILERKVIRNCDAAIAASKKIMEDFNNISKIHLITNGYDHEDFERTKINEKQEFFSMNYFGTIPPESSPVPILKAVNLLFENGIKKINLNFYGNVNDIVEKELKEIDENNLITFHPYIPHNEMLNLLVNSSILVLIINKVKNNKGILTGKIFEYIGSGVPVLGIGPEDGEAAQILKETESGKMFYYDQIEKITEFIEEKFNDWENRKKRIINKKVENYSRINLTRKLAEILKNITS